MYSFLNFFFDTKLYDKLPKFFSRKLFKIFKVFFVPTGLTKLPINNHPSELKYDNEINKIEDVKNKDYRPFISYPYILDLLKIYNNSKKDINFYDFGANNLDLYFFLNKNIKNFTYYYYDQPNYNQVIKKIKNEKKIENLLVDENFELSFQNLDFLYFGSVIQYISDYEKVINSFNKIKPKYVIVSQTPFFDNNNNDNNIIVKQINLHPVINFLYIINLNLFVNFMKNNNYTLISKNISRVIKFINFKNFKNFKKIDMYDLVFKYNEK